MINSIGIQYNSKVYFNRPVSNHFSSVVSRQNLAQKIAFKGNTDPIVEEANKIIQSFVKTNEFIQTISYTCSGDLENVLTKTLFIMQKKIAHLFGVNVKDTDIINFVVNETNRIKNSNPIPILIYGAFMPERITAGTITEAMGERFIQYCQKLKQQA